MSNDSQTSSRLAVAAGVAVATICYWGLWKTKSGTAKTRRETQQRLDAERAQQEVNSDLSGEIEFGAQQCVDSDGEEDLTLDMLMAESDVTDVSEDAETSAQSKGSSSTGAKSPTAHSPTTTTATLGSGTPWSHHVLLNKNSSEYEKWVTTKCRVGERALVRRSKQTGSRATIRFVGTLSVKPGIWVGVELDPEAGPGKNSGQINNEKIFSCARGQGIFCLEDAIEGIDAPLDTLSAAGILAGHWVGERVCGPPKTPTKDVSEQPCSYWFVFEGEGNGYSSNGCSLFLDGRRSSRSEWSIQLREHQFLQRLVLTCQPCGAAPSDATMYALAFLDSNTVELRFAPSHQEFEDGEVCPRMLVVVVVVHTLLVGRVCDLLLVGHAEHDNLGAAPRRCRSPSRWIFCP